MLREHAHEQGPWRARTRTGLGPGGHARAWGQAPAARQHARTHAQRTRGAQAAARVGAPRPPQRPLGGARWGPARPARSFTYSKRHPCGRPTAPTFWALLPSPSPAGAPGTPTSSAPSRPPPRLAAVAARTPAHCRRLSCLHRCRRHLPRLFRPSGPHPPPPAGRAPALPPSRPPPRARQPPLGGPAPPTRPRAGPRAAQAPPRLRPPAPPYGSGANHSAACRRGLRRREACPSRACALGCPRAARCHSGVSSYKPQSLFCDPPFLHSSACLRGSPSRAGPPPLHPGNYVLGALSVITHLHIPRPTERFSDTLGSRNQYSFLLASTLV